MAERADPFATLEDEEGSKGEAQKPELDVSGFAPKTKRSEVDEKAIEARAAKVGYERRATEPAPKEPKRLLQFQVEQSLFDKFTELAVAEFGYEKGMKTGLFLKMFEEYRVRVEGNS